MPKEDKKMAKKKVVYQITRTQYKIIEVETSEQEELVKELNRDFEREDKREKTARARCISLDYLQESEGYEPADDTPTSEESYIEQEEKEAFNARIHQAIAQLTPRQKEMVMMIYFENKSQTEVAKKYKISESAVSHAMERIYQTLRKILEKK